MSAILKVHDLVKRYGDVTAALPGFAALFFAVGVWRFRCE